MNSRREILLELHHTKLEIHRSREEATQSWLDSRPTIDRLEHLKSTLAASHGRISTANSLIFDLHSNLESTHLHIQARKSQEIKTHQTISQLNQDIVQTRHKLDKINVEIDEKREERSELEQTLGVRKQSLKALQMKLRAVKMETRGFEASEKVANGFIRQADVDSRRTVRVSLGDYGLLRDRDEEMGSLADRRIIVSEKQRAVAEANMEKAMMRFKGVELDEEEKGSPESDPRGGGDDVVSSIIMEEISVKNETKKKKKKEWIFVRIKNSLLKKIKKWFG